MSFYVLSVFPKSAPKNANTKEDFSKTCFSTTQEFWIYFSIYSNNRENCLKDIWAVILRIGMYSISAQKLCWPRQFREGQILPIFPNSTPVSFLGCFTGQEEICDVSYEALAQVGQKKLWQSHHCNFHGQIGLGLVQPDLLEGEKNPRNLHGKELKWEGL